MTTGAASAVREALAAALRAQPALAAVAIHEAAMLGAALPRIELQEPASSDWSTKDWRGRELRTAMILRVAEGQRGRLEAMQAAAEAAGEAIGRDLGGWRVASAVLLRTRAEGSKGMRALLIEHRVRVMEI